MPEEEKLGYHKGALESLLNERGELVRLIQIVNSLVERHTKVLENMGVDVDKFMENLQKRQEERISKVQGKSKDKEEKKYDLSKEELPE